MADLVNHLRRNLAQAEHIGQLERAKKLKARIKELETPEVSPSMKKADLLEAAAAAGVEADESMTKAQILEALNVTE